MATSVPPNLARSGASPLQARSANFCFQHPIASPLASRLVRTEPCGSLNGTARYGAARSGVSPYACSLVFTNAATRRTLYRTEIKICLFDKEKQNNLKTHLSTIFPINQSSSTPLH